MSKETLTINWMARQQDQYKVVYNANEPAPTEGCATDDTNWTNSSSQQDLQYWVGKRPVLGVVIIKKGTELNFNKMFVFTSEQNG